MSEFLAEAAVLIRPDTTKFRATLLAELEAATKGITIPVQVVASQRATRELRNTRQAAGELVTVRQRQAVADQAASKASIDLANAQRLVADATAKTAAISEADALAVSHTAQAKARLRAAEAAVAAGRKAETAAVAANAEALIAEARAATASAEAQLADAKAAATEAVEHSRAAGAIAAHAASHHALVSGARAAGASLTGLRGATLATSGAFLVGAASVKLLEESVHEASAEEEAGARVNRLYGASAEELEHNARGLADALGISTRQALVFEGTIGTIAHNAGIGAEEAAHLSQSLVTAAGELAAFANVPVEPVLKAFQLGLIGTSRQLRQYGIDLTAARVTAEALRESGKKNVDQLTAEDRIRARATLLLQQTTVAQAAAERRADSLAQSEKEAKAELANLGGTIGRLVIPQVRDLLKEAGTLVHVLNLLGNAGEEAGKKVGGNQFGHFLGEVQKLVSPTSSPLERLKVLKDAFKLIHPDDVNRPFTIIDEQGHKLSVTFQELHKRAEEAFAAKDAANFEHELTRLIKLSDTLARKAAAVTFQNAVRSLDRLDERMVDLKISGAGAGQQLGLLERQAKVAREAVAAAENEADVTRGKTGHDTAIQRRRDAKNRLLDILNEERDLKKSIADDAKRKADEIKRLAEDAARDIKDAIDAANEALQNAISDIASSLDIRQLRVEATASLQDDLAFQRELQAAIKREIVIASGIVGDARLRAQTIHELTVQLVASEIEEKRLRQEIAKNAQQRRAQAFDRAASSIDLDIELAQTNKDIRAEIRARNARIKLDQERLKAVRGDILATKRLRNDIAEQRAAIKALKGDVDKRRQDLEALAFSFLQTQTGFVANLLSNILPTGAIAGTVGGGAISTATPTPAATSAAVGIPTRGGGGGGGDAGGGVTGTQQQSAQARGVSQGQGTTIIHVLRQVLAELRLANGSKAHPESAIQRGKEAVSLDIIGW